MTAPVNRPMTAVLSMRISILIAMVAMGSGCAKEPPATLSTAKPSPTPQLFEMGRQLYNKQCAVCHGVTGSGNGPAAYLLYPKPRDFTQGEFRLVSTDTMQATDEDLFLTVTRGMPGSAMPPWELLSPEQRWALVYYIRYLEEVGEQQRSGALTEAEVGQGLPWSKVEQLVAAHATEEPIPVPPEPRSSPDALKRGQAIYTQACASCHGPQGRGDGQQVMTDNAGFPIKPRDLTAGVFKGSSESRDLYYRIVAGLPGSPMPSYAEVYTDEQLWDLIHYVQSLVTPGVEDRVRLHAQNIRARRIRGEIPSEPTAEAWRTVPPVLLALTPLWWRDQRVEGVEVKALHNGKELALQLSWSDQTHDSSTVTSQAFSDGAAVEFSLEQDPPFFGMGDANGVVQIWFWKASWQEDLKEWRDVETVYPHAAVDWYEAQRDYRHGEPFEVSQSKTAAHDPSFMSGWGAGNPLSNPHRTSAGEEAVAKGLGTLTSRPPAAQRVQAHGVWHEGQWQVVLRRPLSTKAEDDLTLRSGQQVSVAFAVFDGHAGDRNGQKNVSIWHVLSMER